MATIPGTDDKNEDCALNVRTVSNDVGGSKFRIDIIDVYCTVAKSQCVGGKERKVGITNCPNPDNDVNTTVLPST